MERGSDMTGFKGVALAAVIGLAATIGGGACARMMLGAHVGAESDPTWQQDFIALETAIGNKLAIDNDMEDWAVFPNAARVRWDTQHGHLPMLSWRIVFQRNDLNRGCATADAINAGTYDAQLRRQAAQAKALGVQILVRYNPEMTNNVENTCFTGFPVRQNLSAAGTKYIAAWKHIVDIFRAVGATNVKWVWAPGHKAYAKGQWRLFYPGNDYVDWVGVDYYNKDNLPVSFASDPGILAFYDATASFGKPLIVAETGAVSDPKLNPDAQTLWLTTARSFLKTHPAIKAFVYWNDPGKLRKENPGYGGSGYVLVGPGLAAFRAMANDPYFR
jgi:hypothetical protein